MFYLLTVILRLILIRGVVWVLAILGDNVNPCTMVRFPHTHGGGGVGGVLKLFSNVFNGACY